MLTVELGWKPVWREILRRADLAAKKAEGHVRLWPNWLIDGQEGGMFLDYKKGPENGGKIPVRLIFGYTLDRRQILQAHENGVTSPSRNLTHEELIMFREKAREGLPYLKLTSALGEAVDKHLEASKSRGQSQAP